MLWLICLSSLVGWKGSCLQPSADSREKGGREVPLTNQGCGSTSKTHRVLELLFFWAEVALGTLEWDLGQDSPILNNLSQGGYWHQGSFCPEPGWPPWGSRQAGQRGLSWLRIHLAEQDAGRQPWKRGIFLFFFSWLAKISFIAPPQPYFKSNAHHCRKKWKKLISKERRKF